DVLLLELELRGYLVQLRHVDAAVLLAVLGEEGDWIVRHGGRVPAGDRDLTRETLPPAPGFKQSLHRRQRGHTTPGNSGRRVPCGPPPRCAGADPPCVDRRLDPARDRACRDRRERRRLHLASVISPPCVGCGYRSSS